MLLYCYAVDCYIIVFYIIIYESMTMTHDVEYCIIMMYYVCDVPLLFYVCVCVCVYVFFKPLNLSCFL